MRRARNIFRVATWLGYAAALHFAAQSIGSVLAVYVLASSDLALGSVPESPPAHEGPRSSRPAAPDPRVGARERAAARILGYDPFCPECVDTPPAALLADAPARFAPYGEDGSLGPLLHPGEPPTKLPLELVATMEAERPGRSLATIRHEVRGVGVFARGDEILPRVEVVRVGHGIVHLSNEGTVEYLALQPPEAPRPKTPAPKKAKKKKKKKSTRAIEGADEAIDCAKQLQCRIDRSFVEMLIRKPALLVRQGRMKPHKKRGEMLGFRLSGARRDTLPGMLGMRNGDVVTEINGQALGSMDSALGLFGKLRHASHLDVTIVRKGKTLTMSLDIV